MRLRNAGIGFYHWRGLISAVALLAVACTSTNPEPAFRRVEESVAARSGESLHWRRDAAGQEGIDATIKELLAEDLTVEEAVRIGLMNSPALQATYEELGISQAELAEAGLLKNPVFGLSIRRPEESGLSRNLEHAVAADLLDLILLPARKRMAARELAVTELRVADEVLRHIAEVKTAYYTAEAQEQLATRLGVVLEADEAAAELAQGQFDAGNINELDLVNQRLIANQTRIEQEVAAAEQRRDREELARVLGIAGLGVDWILPAELPGIPAEGYEAEALVSLALEQRLDLAAMNKRTEALAKRLGFDKGTALLPSEVKAGYDAEREPDKQWLKGGSVELDVPVFNQGQARVARGTAQWRQAVRQGEALANEVRAEVGAAHAVMEANRTAAQVYREQIFPGRARALRLTLELYNYMLKGAYELLIARQDQVHAERGYIEAYRDYWIARAELERAIGGRLPAGNAVPEEAAEAPAEAPKEEAPHEHHH